MSYAKSGQLILQNIYLSGDLPTRQKKVNAALRELWEGELLYRAERGTVKKEEGHEA